jgi:hypothetical protein
MSRYLPPHPNLDHLKKQAKDLLRDLKQRNPATKLADAQHALAREYGFASWPKLKVYVDSLPRPSAPSGEPEDEVVSASTRLEGMPEKTSPFTGIWTANLSKSKRHPANPFHSATVQFTVAGDMVTIINVVVDESGREEHGKSVLLADGNEHWSENGNGYVLVARWRGAHLLETIATQDGQAAGWGTYQVSDDGQTFTISGDQQMIVFDRSPALSTAAA